MIYSCPSMNYARRKIAHLLRFTALFASLLMSTLPVFSQINLDSLKRVWNNETLTDSTRLQTIQVIAWDGFLFNNQDSALYYAQLQYDFAQAKGSKKWMANALNTQGVAMYYQNNYKKALDYHTRSLEIKEELKNRRGIAISLNNIGMVYELQSEYEKALDYYNQSYQIASEIDNKRAMANALNNIAIVFKFQGKYAEAIENYTKSLNLKEEIGYKRGMVSSLSNIGTVYFDQGAFERSIENYIRALKISEELGDKQRIYKLLANIGNVYVQHGDSRTAIDYHTRSLALAEEMHNKQGVAITLHDIGSIYHNRGEYDTALNYYSRSLTIKEAVGDKHGTISSLNAIGNIYKTKGELARALDYQKRGLRTANEVGSKKGIAQSLNSIGLIHLARGENSSAVRYSSEALAEAQELGSILEIKAAAANLYRAYGQSGNHRLSLEMYELYIKMRDSIENIEVQKEVIRQEFQYVYEKQATADSVAFAKQQELNSVREANRRYLLSGGFAFVLILTGIYFRVKTLKKNAEREALLQEIKLLKVESVVKAASNPELKEQLVLDKQKIEEAIDNSLNPSDWNILNTLFDNPAIGNNELADKVALSVAGVRSSLQKMYRFFRIDKSANQRMILVMEATKISNNF